MSDGREGAPTGQWIMDEQWQQARTPEPDTDPHMFMTANNISPTDFRAALVEYRNLDTGYMGSPWAQDEIGVLSTDFINWYRWERL